MQTVYKLCNLSFFLSHFQAQAGVERKTVWFPQKADDACKGLAWLGLEPERARLRQVTTATASGLPLCRSWVTGALADAQASNQSSFPDIIFPAVAYFQMCFSISIICSAYETVRHSYLGFITFGFLQIFLYMKFCTKSYGVYVLLKLWALQNKSFFLAECL